MNHALSLVAIAGSVSACASFVIAQSEPIRPQYYSWEKHPVLESNPSDPDFFEYNDRFAAMVRVVIDSSNTTGTTPGEAADATIAEILARLSEGSGTIKLNNLAITIQNVGGYMPSNDPTAYEDTLFSFFRGEDAGPTTPENQNDPAEYRLYQPWMGQAVGEYRLNTLTQELEWHTGDVYTWVKDYCEALKDGIDDEQLSTVPVRFHFDYEGNIFGSSWNSQIVRQIIACEQDSRWDSAEVPGFPGQTMEDLWHAAQDEYGWKGPNNSYRTIDDALDQTRDASHTDNIPYILWWNKVTNRVLSAVMERCVYEPIKASWPNAEILVSNYQDATADMAVDTFGYREVMDPTSVVTSGGQLLSFSQQNSPSNLIETDEYYRGFYSLNAWGDFPNYAALSTTGGPPLLFVMSESSNYADFDSPVLYYPKLTTESGDGVATIAGNHLQGRLYEPRDLNGAPVQETVVQSMNRTFRHYLEAILNTPGRAPHGVAPWIAFPGIGAVDTNNTLVGIDEIRRQLALFRSKDIREVILWGNKQGAQTRGTPSAWNAVKRADDQVYSPYIKSVELVRGGATVDWSEQALNTTLRTDDPAELKVGGDYAGSPSNFEVTEIVVRFHGIKPMELGNAGRLVLECSIIPEDWTQMSDPTAWLDSARGQIAVWNEVLGQWDPMTTVYDTAPGEYRFYVEDLNSPGRGLTRREWDIGYDSGGLCNYLTDQQGDECSEGVLNFKFTHLAPETSSGFRSSYDLIMFYHQDDLIIPIGGGEPLGMMASSSSTGGVGGFLTADFNFDGVQDSVDAEMFAEAWTNGERRADYNADGEVDSLDLTQFLGALSRATSAGGSSEW